MKEIVSYGRLRCKELSPHKNRGMENTYIEKGSLEWMVEGVSERIEPGCVFFTLPWQVHGSMYPTEADNIILHVLFHLEQDYSKPRRQFRFLPFLCFNPAEMKILSEIFSASPKHCFPATNTMQKLMPELIHELQNTQNLRRAHSISLLRAILVELKRTICGETSDHEMNSPSGKKVQRLLTELSSNCDRQWTLEQMADRCGIRRTYLNTVFQKMTGSTPMEYLASLRIAKAKTLLRDTKGKVIDIALECGFGSSQYFSNTFKQVCGMTPSEYRTHCANLTADDLRKLSSINFRSEQEELRRIKAFGSN
jgi:AraC family L-rhamnose operon regulatory protein RhaS